MFIKQALIATSYGGCFGWCEDFLKLLGRGLLRYSPAQVVDPKHVDDSTLYINVNFLFNHLKGLQSDGCMVGQSWPLPCKLVVDGDLSQTLHLTASYIIP